MAKCAMVALVLATLLVAGMAAQDFTEFSGRTLQQATFKCSQAKGLNRAGACQAIQGCLEKNAPKNLNTPANRRLFAAGCANCAKAVAGPCPAGDALPSQCRGGLSIPAVVSCITSLSG